jgi:hypothetical protein
MGKSGVWVLLALLAAACAASLPAPEARQLRLRDAEDVAAMRRHGWAVLAGVTRPAPGGGPGFARWHSLAETFGGGAGFRRIDQVDTGMPVLQGAGAPMMMLVQFNEPAYRHIRSQGLYRRATLAAINAGFSPATPLDRRTIAPFPRDALAIKTVWTVVHAEAPTPVSVWDGAGAAEPAAWPRTVMVGPGGVPLSRFYHLPIAAADLPAIRAIDPTAQAGDHLVLLAVHLTTREIPDWIWATWWWHDRPDVGPFAAGRPAALGGAWRNYLMDVAYSAETPREADGTPNAMFNPYLETSAGGHASNCMACHQGAVWTAAGPAPFLPVTRGARPPDDPLFRTGTRLDFMWSIAREAR